MHEADYAEAWFHKHSTKDLASMVAEYNAYLQTLDDLQAGRVALPEGADGKQIAQEVQRYALSEFRSHALERVNQQSDYHKALYAYCVKRYLTALRDGRFASQLPLGSRGDEQGEVQFQQRPDIAEAIEAHVDRKFFAPVFSGDN